MRLTIFTLYGLRTIAVALESHVYLDFESLSTVLWIVSSDAWSLEILCLRGVDNVAE